ncbi:SmORF protein [Babesia bovis T2Bo]|uniref:SmORF n=1 Tax=Babesia bovis TaxID=5865 RepID=A7AQB4_BABBO|nr:SmORF protein [Babesia bovis T2Bo]KAG6440017.1 SmORF protein [Babesia bovis T2Bo]|eukprot:XP_001612316.1 SmORF [Babesia bovis]
MVAFNMLWKVCLVGALGFSATVTSTEVAQEQSTQEGLDKGVCSKEKEQATELVEVPEPTRIDTPKHADIVNPPKYSVEWYLLPKPQNRKYLRDKLPWHLYNAVPKDCNDPIDPLVEKEIREFFSVRSVEWYLESKPINRAALRYAIPAYLAEKVPLDCNEPISPATERRIRGFFSYSERMQRFLRLF